MKNTSHRCLQSGNSEPNGYAAANRRRRLTRLLAFGLRHNPVALGIELDTKGWTDLAPLVASLRSTRGWENVSPLEIEQLVHEDLTTRFEMDQGRIRALYGHSVKSVSSGILMNAPALLFHATRAADFNAIRANGIAARSRCHAHLTSCLTYALNVKADHESSGSPGILFGVETKKAFVPFYKASEVVWTTPFVPPSALALVVLDCSPRGYKVLPLPNNSALSFEPEVASYASLLRDETDDT